MTMGQGMKTIDLLSRTEALERMAHKPNMLTTEDMRPEIERLEATEHELRQRVQGYQDHVASLEQDLVDLRHDARTLQERLKLTEAARDLAQGENAPLKAEALAEIKRLREAWAADTLGQHPHEAPASPTYQVVYPETAPTAQTHWGEP